MGRRLALAILLGLGQAPGADAAPSLDGTVYFESDTAWRVYSPRRAQKSQNRIAPELTLQLNDDWGVHAHGWLLYDPIARLNGPDPDFGEFPVDRWNVGGSRHVEAELRELYADWRGRVGGARLDVRLGKQQVVWGQSFGLRVLDVVNPQDFREFILDDFVTARTPTWGARLDGFAGGLTFQALAFPDWEPDDLADPESEFAFSQNLRGLFPGLAAAPGRAPTVILGEDEKPVDASGQAWSFGGRVGGVFRGVDWGLFYWDRTDPLGAFERRVVPVDGGISNVLRRRHRRLRSGGFSFSAAVANFTLWGEGTVSGGRQFVVDDLGDSDGIVQRPDLQYALGLDWNGWSPLFANLQFIQYVIFDHDSRIQLDAFRHFLSVLLRFDLLGETLFPQLFVLYGVEDNESMLRPSIEWRATDRLSLVLGADLFTGPSTGLLGQFSARRSCVPAATGGCLFDPFPGRPSRVFLRFRYEFGFGL